MGSEKFESFKEENLYRWGKKIYEIFPNEIPESYIWNDIVEIVKILNIIGENNLNHTFLPTGGGLDLTGADYSEEIGCIKLYFGFIYDIVKPYKLIFHSFGDSYEWAYFRLETYELEQSNVYKTKLENNEEVVDLGNASYIDRKFWDMGFYYDENQNKKEFDNNATVVTRHFNGSFVIFAKSSIYNRVSSTYDGRHNKMSDERFRKYIRSAVDSLKEKRVF